jgi:cellulose biosynthesis protein BcsQ
MLFFILFIIKYISSTQSSNEILEILKSRIDDPDLRENFRESNTEEEDTIKKIYERLK